MTGSKCIDRKMGALLLGYELGALPLEEIERFEVHLLQCDYCFNELTSFRKQTSLLSSDPEIRSITETRARKAARSESFPGRLWGALWPQTFFMLKPAVIYLLLLVIAAPMIYIWRKAPDSDGRIERVQTIRLTIDRSSQDAVFETGFGRDGVISFVCPDAAPGRTYTVIVRSADGREIVRYEDFDDFDSYGVAELLFPESLMEPGVYDLIVIDPGRKDSSGIWEYRFKIE